MFSWSHHGAAIAAFLGCRFHADKPCYSYAQHGGAGREANLIFVLPPNVYVGPPPVGGLFGFKSSSRRHPRKFGVNRFLVVREVAGGEMGWPVFGLPPLEKIIGGVTAIVSCRPGGWIQQSTVPRCAILRWEARESLAVKRREFISLVGGTAAALPLAARAQQPAMPVVGFVSGRSPGSDAYLVEGFRRGLRVSTGSLPLAMTTGTIADATRKPPAATSAAPAKSTVTFRSMSSAIIAGSRSSRPSAQRNSRATFWPSVKPFSRKPRRKPSTR